MSYVIIENSVIVCQSDSKIDHDDAINISGCPANSVGMRYIDGKILDPIPDISEYSAAIQKMLDSEARGMGYDSIFTAVTYAMEPSVKKFQDEGRSLMAWRSIVWDAAAGIMSDIESGARSAPSIDEVISELPGRPA